LEEEMIRSRLDNKALLISVLLLLNCPGGCLRETKSLSTGVETEIPCVSVLPADLIDARVRELTRISHGEGLSPDDREIVRALLKAYESLQSSWCDLNHEQIIALLFDSLRQLDAKYVQKLGTLSQQEREVLREFAEKRKKIMDDYLMENFQEVINDCLELEAAFGADNLSPEIGMIFALSLAKKGFLKEASTVGEKIILEMKDKPELVYLATRLIEWQLALGHREDALETRETMVDYFREIEATFKETETGWPRHQTAQGSLESMGPAPPGNDRTDLEHPDPLERLLREVEILVHRHEYQEAKLLLIRERIKLEQGPEIVRIDTAMKSVELSEQAFREEKIIGKTQEDETLKLARKLLEEDKFEEAIDVLEDLRGRNPENAADARAIEEEAVSKWINRERNKAAKLFLQAKNTSNVEEKGRLLVSSYNILKVILAKYPSSTLNKRTNDNLNRVKDEMARLGISPP
jgi:hypothetical protein